MHPQYFLQGGIDRTKAVDTELKARRQLQDFLYHVRLNVIRLKRKVGNRKAKTIATYVHNASLSQEFQQSGWQR